MEKLNAEEKAAILHVVRYIKYCGEEQDYFYQMRPRIHIWRDCITLENILDNVDLPGEIKKP